MVQGFEFCDHEYGRSILLRNVGNCLSTSRHCTEGLCLILKNCPNLKPGFYLYVVQLSEVQLEESFSLLEGVGVEWE
jgi:hypothetical protein